MSDVSFLDFYFFIYSNPSLPRFLFHFTFFSEQKFQTAGVRLDHEALKHMIRFLLLTFRYLTSDFITGGHVFYHIVLIYFFCESHTNISINSCAIRCYSNICVTRSAGKNNLSGDDLVSRLEESSNKWSKASLQVLHRLWSEHGASVHAQQELQAMLSIGQVHSDLIQ